MLASYLLLRDTQGAAGWFHTYSPRCLSLAAQAQAPQVCLEKFIPSLTLDMFPGSITGSIFFSV